MLRPLRFGVGLFTAAYVAAVVFFVARQDSHTYLELLVVQYLLLLPAILCFLKAEKGSGGLDHTRASNVVRPRVLYAVYVILVLSLALLVQHRLPSGDESSYHFQSRIFANGRLTAEAPPRTTPDDRTYQREFRFHHHIIHNNKWFSKYPPGWPALLAFGGLMRVDWLLNPALGLLILWFTYRIAILLFDSQIASLALFFVCASPFFTFHCMGFLSHPACSALVAAATLFFFRGLRSHRTADFVWMLLFLGAGLLVRPSTTTYVALVLGPTTLWVLRHDRSRLVKVLCIAFSVVAGTLAVLLLYNHALTGSYLRTTYALYAGSQYPPEITFRLGQDWIRWFLLRSYRWTLQGTAIYSYPFLFLLAAYGVLRAPQRRRGVYLLAALFGALLVGRIFPPGSSGSLFGERLYFETFFALAILAAVGWKAFRRRWALGPKAVRLLAGFVVATQVFHYVYFVERGRVAFLGYYRVQNALNNLNLSQAVVFLKSGEGFTAMDFNQNDADWRRARIFYMPDPGSARRRTVACVLGRPRWAVLSYDDQARSARLEDLVDNVGCEEQASIETDRRL